MSSYTTELRFICERCAEKEMSVGQTKVKDVISASAPVIFDFDFPIFDESYRSVLEHKILRHYYFYEIGLETYGLWKVQLETKLNEIMPYYNQLYKSELLEFDPFNTVNITTEGRKNRNGTEDKTGKGTVTNDRTGGVDRTRNTGTETSTNQSTDNNSNVIANVTDWDLYHDTPQGGISSLNDETYLTNARKKTNNGTSQTTEHGTVTGDGTGKEDVKENETRNEKETETRDTTENTKVQNIDDYIERRWGKDNDDSYSKMLTEFRETFLNIDMMVIDELAELFMLIW